MTNCDSFHEAIKHRWRKCIFRQILFFVFVKSATSGTTLVNGLKILTYINIRSKHVRQQCYALDWNTNKG